MTMCSVLVRAGAASWILVVCVASTYGQVQIPTDRIPAFAVPKMSQPPKIDGKIDPAEWRESAAVSGVVNQADNVLFPRPTTFFLAWDAENLYLACRTWVMPGYKPRAYGRSPHAACVSDDGMELHFQPMGKNVPKGRTDSSYKFFINCIGLDGDLMRVAVGQQFKNWMPAFRTGSRVTKPGTAPNGGSWLEIELAASPKDFELVGPHQAGDAWKLMLGFNHMPMWMQARIPSNTGYFDPGGYCVATLVENTPAVQERMEDLPGPCDGVAAVTFQIYNPTAQPAQIGILAHYTELTTKTVEKNQVTETADLLKKEQTLTVEPGKVAEFKLNEKFPRDLGRNRGAIYYRVTYGDKELLRYYAYLRVGYDKSLMTYTPPKEAFPLTATFNPIRSNILLQGDAYFTEDPDAAKSLDFRIVREGESKPVVEGNIDRIVTYYLRKLVQLPPLDEGTYSIEATISTKDGKRIGPVKTSFKKLDEARVFSEWWKKGLGNAERVIPPFEPMTRSGQTVTVWGREYVLDSLGLPAAITSQKERVLAAPARIIVAAGGKETSVPLDAPLRFTETKEWRVAFEGRAAGAGLSLTSKGYVEQDGFGYIELTYGPVGKEPVTVEALRIEFPIVEGVADCLLVLGTGGNFSSRTTMLLPRGREGLLWSAFDTGRLGSYMTVGSFYPCVWIGNERCGLLWWGDNDRGWVPDDDVPSHSVRRQGGEVVLSNNIIGKPFELAEPRTIAFSYMASPFRPLVKGWRAAIMSEDGTFSGGEAHGFKWRKDPKTGRPFDGWNLLTPPSADPKEWSAIWAEYKQKADAKVRAEQPFGPSEARRWMFVHTSLPLVGYGWKSPDWDTMSYLAPEFGDTECYTDTNIDYYLYLADRAFREGGLRTIYWDIFFPCLHHSVQNGVAYELPDGRVQPGYTGFNTRRFMMRMYALMTDHKLTPGAQVSHATNDYLLVACPWMDAILDGEYHILKDESAMDWVDGYPVERMRAMSCAHNFGTVISWMNLIQITDPKRKAAAYRGFVEYPRLYDSWKGSGVTYPQSVLDWGLNDKDIEYIPFWRNRYVKCDDADALVSMWRLPDRVLLAVFNYNGKQGKDFALKVDLDGLGLVPRLQWQEFIGVRDLDKGDQEPASRLDFYGRTLTVPAMAPHTGRLIGIRLY